MLKKILAFCLSVCLCVCVSVYCLSAYLPDFIDKFVTRSCSCTLCSGLVVHNYEQQLSKEEDEYYAALNEQNLEEHKKKHLEEQYEKTSHHVAMLRSQVDELIKRQEEREDLLSEIFDGDYGSEKEQELELKVSYDCYIVCFFTNRKLYSIME